MDKKFNWLQMAQHIQSIAQAGLTYSEGKYDLERYEELRKISVEIMSDFTDTPMEKATSLFANEEGYQTPKVDVRGVVFKEGKILMVRETQDGLWSLPGGWADVGYTPKEIAVKEVFEETGYKVEADRLLAIVDKKCYPHPLDIYYVYKIFILCKLVGGTPATSIETSEIDFFDRDNLPELSQGRILPEQIEMLFSYLDNPEKPAWVD